MFLGLFIWKFEKKKMKKTKKKRRVAKIDRKHKHRQKRSLEKEFYSFREKEIWFRNLSSVYI